MTSLQATAMGGGAANTKTANYVLVAADAGTTVAMNAAGATTITVNTSLFAAGDTVFIQNIGAGACTITAGTATVATAGSLILPQNDAGILYFTSTGVSIFYDFIQVGAASPLTTKGDLYTFGTSDTRLPVGANGTILTADSSVSPTGLKWAVDPVADIVTTAGDLIYGTAADTVARLGIGTVGQVLAVNSGATAPEWVTPAAGGMTLISSQTMASVSSVTFSSIPGTYTNLHLIIRGYYSSSGTPLMQWELNSDTTTGNYIGVADINRLVTSSNQEQWNTKAIVGSGMTYRTTSTSYNIISMTIPDYTNTVSWKYSFTEAIQLTDFSATDRAFMYGINSWQNNSAITNIKILNSSANNWTAGTALLYGVK